MTYVNDVNDVNDVHTACRNISDSLLFKLQQSQQYLCENCTIYVWYHCMNAPVYWSSDTAASYRQESMMDDTGDLMNKKGEYLSDLELAKFNSYIFTLGLTVACSIEAM